jgi:hypothetical protein
LLDKVLLRQVFLRALRFTLLNLSSHRYDIFIHLSSGVVDSGAITGHISTETKLSHKRNMF